jgi:cytoskeletal protein RodZ
LQKPSMNRLYRLPLRTGLKNLSSGARRRRNFSKIIAIGILVLCAIAALVAIGIAAYSTLKHLTERPKPAATATAATSPAATPSPVSPANGTSDVLPPLEDPNKAASEGIVTGQPSAAQPSAAQQPATQQPSPASTIPTPASTPAVVPQHEQKTDSQPASPEKPLSKSARKNLEKKRIEAERKRARLEQMYQKHEISTDTYNKGKEEYKSEIQKYRNQIKPGN